MQYRQNLILRNGKACTLRNLVADDAEEMFACFQLTHGQTENLTTYPDENSYDESRERAYIEEKEKSADEIEICALMDGHIVGSAGIEAVRRAEKTRHRATYGISIDQAYWGMGIGRALTKACIACARQAGYAQLELEVVASNEAALALYRSEGFVEFGRNPKGFRARQQGWQEVVLMRLEL